MTCVARFETTTPGPVCLNSASSRRTLITVPTGLKPGALIITVAVCSTYPGKASTACRSISNGMSPPSGPCVRVSRSQGEEVQAVHVVSMLLLLLLLLRTGMLPCKAEALVSLKMRTVCDGESPGRARPSW